MAAKIHSTVAVFTERPCQRLYLQPEANLTCNYTFFHGVYNPVSAIEKEPVARLKQSLAQEGSPGISYPLENADWSVKLFWSRLRLYGDQHTWQRHCATI